MLKDLNIKPVEGLSLVIAKTPEETGEHTFYLYLINENDYELENVMVMTEAFEHEDGSGKSTSKLRHFFDAVAPQGQQKIETVDPSVFGFHNRVWVSYYKDGEMRDRKFLFKPFVEFDLEPISSLDLKGRIAE